MAKKTITSIYDDIDHTEGGETVTFSLDGKSYEIDLNEKNTAKLAKALEPFITAGRAVSGARRSSSSAANKKDLNAIRAWARENGMEVSDRGRVAGTIVEAYEAASK